MRNRKALEIDISVSGVLPRKFAEDAAAVLKESERVEVAFRSGRAVLKTVWEADAELALMKLRTELQLNPKTASPRVLYLHEPRLLEPIMELQITVPEGCMGEVMGDINRRRGLVESLEESEGGNKLIVCKVPLAELFGYTVDLRCISNGDASVRADFDSYQPVPEGSGPDEPVSGALRA